MQLITRTATSALLALALSPLACASTNDPQETARKLLERGAYAEEHERDFAAAAELYAQAVEAATAANDTTTANAAEAARNRILARQGTPVAPATKAAWQEVPPQALRLLLEGSRSDPKTPEGQALIKDLAIAGASVVPKLEMMFSLETPTMIGDGVLSLGITPTQLYPNPTFAVYALAAIDGPEARAALERCYASPDPLVRHALVSAIGARWDFALLERALRDPVDSIAGVAINRLRGYANPNFADDMELGAKRGNAEAANWLARFAAERLLTLAEDRATALDQRLLYVKALSQNGALDPDIKTAQRLLSLGREPGEESLSRLAFEALNYQWTHQAWRFATELREPLGEFVMAELELKPTTQLISLLKLVAPTNTPGALLRAMQKIGAPLPTEVADAIRNTVSGLPFDASEEAFDGWMELLRNLPRFEPVEPKGGASIAGQVLIRLRNLAPSAPLESLAKGARNLPTPLRQQYGYVLEARVKEEVQHGRRGGSSGQSGGLDPAILPVAFAWLDLDWERAGSDVARCLIEVGDVEQLPRALDLYCNVRIGGANNSAGSAVNRLININPERAAVIVEQRLAKLVSQPAAGAAVDQRLRALGYVAEGESGIVQDNPSAVVRTIGFFPSAQALALFRNWYPKLGAPKHKHILQEVLVEQIDGAEAIAEIVRLYPEFIEAETRHHAVERLGAELIEGAIPLLGDALRDPDSGVRKAAQDASAAFKQQREALEEFAAWTNASQAQRESTAELIALLASPNRDVVLGAVRSLGAIRASTALPALVKLLERNDPELKKAVQEAISRFAE